MVAIFLDRGNVVANILSPLDIGSQDIAQLGFAGNLFFWRLRGRGKLPTVSSEANIGEDKKNHADKNNPSPPCEIATHQVLEYTVVN
jgi:hypothetical protein